jgi:hypothetical protein
MKETSSATATSQVAGCFVKLGSQVSGVVETKVCTADKQPVALLAKK